MDEEGLSKVIALARSEWRRLLPVTIGIFVLNSLLTFILVEVASPVVNLDSMLPFYEILENSTALGAVAGDEPDIASSPFWKLHLTGEFFWNLSFAVAMFFFSEACHPQEDGGAGAVRTWRQWWSIFSTMVLAVLLGLLVPFVILGVLEGIDHLREFDALVECGYLLIAVVVSRENRLGFRAIRRAWRLVLERRKEAALMSLIFLLVLNGLGNVFTVFYLGHAKKESPPTIRENKLSEILRFSLVAALVDVIMQSFVCLRILVFYRDFNGQGPNADMVEQPQAAHIQALTKIVQEGFAALGQRIDELQAIVERLH